MWKPSIYVYTKHLGYIRVEEAELLRVVEKLSPRLRMSAPIARWNQTTNILFLGEDFE